MGIMQLCDAMMMAKLDADTVDDVNRKFDMLWEAYQDAYENSEEGHE